ncbi:hypothetical protein OENI_390004 [Oenococcus oeni]|nr:hypothetical protein OENI_390004 [Oenococcus oeni]
MMAIVRFYSLCLSKVMKYSYIRYLTLKYMSNVLKIKLLLIHIRKIKNQLIFKMSKIVSFIRIYNSDLPFLDNLFSICS